MKGKTDMILGALLICAFLWIMPMAHAAASESAQVNIPVIAYGADCTAELYGSDGIQLHTIRLIKDVPSSFTIECVGLKQFDFSIRLADHDTETVQYDHTQYDLRVILYYNSEDQVGYSIIVDTYGVLGKTSQGKKEALEFYNVIITPPPTPVPYPYCFTFTKLWQGGHEDSIDWILYRQDGSVLHKKFNKRYISENEWYYEAWFPEPVDDCYIIETIPDGYKVRYENVGAHAGETDRCYNGGTIINYKVPKTGDDNNLWLWLGCVLLGVSAVCGTLIFSRKKNTHQ